MIEIQPSQRQKFQRKSERERCRSDKGTPTSGLSAEVPEGTEEEDSAKTILSQNPPRWSELANERRKQAGLDIKSLCEIQDPAAGE